MYAKRRAEGTRKRKGAKPLDRVSQKRRPGRPRDAEPDATVRMRALNYRTTLRSVWRELEPLISSAQNADDIAVAWRSVGLQDGEGGFRRLAVLAGEIFAISQEKGYRQLRADGRCRYVADSLATVGRTKFRRSRDIASKAEPPQEHQIRHAEAVWHVECSCGYSGPSKAYGCAKCGAKIPPFYLIPR